jgi:hypothetical protein
VKYLAQYIAIRAAPREIRTIVIAERADGCLAVLPADLAILIAVASVEPWCFHRQDPKW